jgi:hypothetical protein
MAVSFSYNAPSNTYTIIDDGTFTMAQWYAYDLANSIGKITQDATTKQYVVMANIVLGNGATATILSDLGIQLQVGSPTTLLTFTVALNSLILLSKSYFQHFAPTTYSYVYGTVSFVNVYFASNGNQGFNFQAGSLFTGSKVTLDYVRWVFHNSPNISRLNLVNSASIFYILTSTGAINDIECETAISVDSPYTCTVSNSNFTGSTLASFNLGLAGTAVLTLLNVTAAHWHFTSNGSVGTWIAYVKYPFNLNVVDNQSVSELPLQGARVQILDKNSVDITQTGQNYTTVPNVILSAPPQGGVQATATAILGNIGQIIGFTITNGGSGYVTAPIISFNGGGGSLSTAIATIVDGVVTAITPTLFTDVNGNITTITLFRGYYDKAHGDTLQDNAPLWLKISKAGYMDYKDPMSPTMKTQYQISMNRQVPIVLTVEGRKLVDMKPADPQSLFYTELS